MKSDSGVTAWLVEDYSVPIISLQFAFRGGETQDPIGKEGLVNLMTGLFDEGAGDLDSDAFQNRLDDAGAEMRFSGGRDAIYGSMRMLAEEKDEALELLRLAVEKPRFDQLPIDRIRSQIVASIIADARDPGTAAQLAWSKALYGDHPYSRQDEGTQATLATITADDLKTLHRRLFARDNLIVGVVGAIDAETLKKELDLLFGGLPEKAELTPVADVQLKLGQEIDIPYELPQTTLQVRFSRRRPQQARIFRRLSDEPHSGWRRFQLAAVHRSAGEARACLQRQLGAGELRSRRRPGDFDGDALRSSRRDHQGDPRPG